ncbi:DMT family transporter [Williamsia sterculiae]|uniref:Magnesium transporter NIPA n=1 Tax=Williamsia sterculiae TaxID=1344003 RepID=A0A1N7GNZ8_9NOCA|nr:DMT family transporter [Williamsia sterculiae]SIS14314.1 hypothetical protein SAMN05445060_2945 [Williamsia sterculiae]
MHTWLPALLAVCSAFVIALGTVLRQRCSTREGAPTAGWWFGAGIAVAGFGLMVAALALGSVLLVQPLVVLAVLFAMPMEAWLDHRRPRRIEWIWGGVLVAAVAVFLVIADPESSDRRPDHVVIGGSIGGVFLLVVLLVIAAERSSTHYRALCYGLGAGVLFGASAIVVKAAAYQVLHRGIGVFAHPEIYLFAVAATGAVVAQQRAFGAGELQTSFPAMSVTEPATAMLLGVLLLGEVVDAGWWRAIIMVVMLLLIMRSVVQLAKASAMRETGQDNDDPVRV